MKTIDPGHTFALDDYSGHSDKQTLEEQFLVFMHRIGDRYPGNQGNPYDGTNCQEVLRALITRYIYLNNQIPSAETELIIHNLRYCLLLNEIRAARVHNLELPLDLRYDIENVPACRHCGHLVCEHRG